MSGDPASHHGAARAVPTAVSGALADSLRLSARVALAGIAAFALAVLVLHGLQPALDPATQAVSFYVHGAHGWLLTAGLLALGLGSLALTVGLARSVRGAAGARAGRWCLGVWGAGVLLGGIFPADPPGNWSAPPSVAGLIHGNAALVAFLALPAAAVLLSRAFRRDPNWRGVTAASSALAAAVVICLILFLASLAPAIVSPGPPVLLGLTERALIAACLAWLGVAAVGMLRVASAGR